MRWATILGVLCAVGCGGGGSVDPNGVVKVGFNRAQSQDAQPIPPDTIAVSLEYGECLLDYYEANPDMRQDGVEGECARRGQLHYGVQRRVLVRQ